MSRFNSESRSECTIAYDEASHGESVMRSNVGELPDAHQRGVNIAMRAGVTEDTAQTILGLAANASQTGTNVLFMPNAIRTIAQAEQTGVPQSETIRIASEAITHAVFDAASAGKLTAHVRSGHEDPLRRLQEKTAMYQSR